MLRALTWPPVSHPGPRTSCAALVQCRDLSGPRPPLRNGVRVALTSGRANTQRGQRGSAGQGPLCPLCPSAPGACHALVGRSWGACSLVREDRGLAMATKQQARGMHGETEAQPYKGSGPVPAEGHAGPATHPGGSGPPAGTPCGAESPGLSRSRRSPPRRRPGGASSPQAPPRTQLHLRGQRGWKKRREDSDLDANLPEATVLAHP